MLISYILLLSFSPVVDFCCVLITYNCSTGSSTHERSTLLIGYILHEDGITVETTTSI